MVGMHDAPLISPENKDSDREVIAKLPKVILHERFEEGRDLPQEPAQLTQGIREALEELKGDSVVYVELEISPERYSFGAQEAVQAALAGADVPGIDARLILRIADSAELAAQWVDSSERVVGVAIEDAALQERLHADLVPSAVYTEDVTAAAVASAQRLISPVGIIDDFTASVEGIVPGKVSAWARDRRIALAFSPALEASVENLADHPLPLLQQLGFTCTVNTGSARVTTVTDQFEALSETFGYGLEEFFDLTLKAVENSFSSQEDRQHLLETVILPAYEELSETTFAEDAEPEDV